MYCIDWFEFVSNWQRSHPVNFLAFFLTPMYSWRKIYGRMPFLTSTSRCHLLKFILSLSTAIPEQQWHITPFMLALWHQGQNMIDGSSKTWGLSQSWYQEYRYYGPVKKKERKDNKEAIRTQVHLEKLCICPYFFGLWFINIVSFVAIGLQNLPHQQSVKASLIPADIFGE